MLTALEYFEIKKRMSKVDIKGFCNEPCTNCPISSYNNGVDVGCLVFEKLYPEKAIELVEKWNEEHSVKTIKDDLLEKHPNARLNKDDEPRACALDLGYVNNGECSSFLDCKECWNTLYFGG